MTDLANREGIYAKLHTGGVVARARKSARDSGRSVVEELQDNLKIDHATLLATVAAYLELPLLPLANMLQCKPAFDLISFAEAARRQCVALRDQDEKIVVAVSDPFSDVLSGWLTDTIQTPFALHVAEPNDIAGFLAKQEASLRALDSFSVVADDAKSSFGNTGTQLSFKDIDQDASPTVKLVNSIVYDGLKAAASDIHLESGPDALCIKYRLDGVLNTIRTIPGREANEQLVSRIKVMSNLDIAEHRIPQDGRFRVVFEGRDVDFRVSVMPCIHGEDVVLRILDKSYLTRAGSALNLETLGFDAPVIRQLRNGASQPYGMLLVTGPTGSGKTTTLYAMLSEINNGRDKFVTIEDPVEYHLPGVLQIPVNEKKGLTFSLGLRSILRHDPDKIMVGEIRDSDTAHIAVQSALTGHLVFTTVHANSVFDVIGRFMHMNVDPQNFVSALNMVVAQRLIRTNCPQCSGPVDMDDAVAREFGLNKRAGMTLRRGSGCGHCRGTGYKGRRAVAELLVLNDEIREAIAGRGSLKHIKALAYQNGVTSLRDAALALVARGETTLEEVNRVTLAS